MSEAGLVNAEEIFQVARTGRPFVLIDETDLGIGGDVVIPAEFATPQIINFMAKHARGLICLALTADRAAALNLEPMAERNNPSEKTIFTTSIEAREGVTTGISAHDRAHTIAVATDPAKGSQDIATPGHVFPLVARDGGVLVRAGNVEAAVDVARIAGLRPAAAICKVMDVDGSVARLPELIRFAGDHDLKVGTITDLIAFRRKSETIIEKISEVPFDTHFGTSFRLHIYRDTVDGGEHIALVKGQVAPATDTLVRMHQVDLLVDLLGWSAARRDYVPRAMQALAAHDGPAVAVFLQDPDTRSLARRVMGHREEYVRTHTERDYGIGAQILLALGVSQMTLLTSSQSKSAAMERYGLNVTRSTGVPKYPLSNDTVDVSKKGLKSVLSAKS